MYGMRNGLGFDYYDLLASAGGVQQCDARDSACVASNEQITDAVRALWTNKYMTDPNTANLPAPPVNVQVDASPAALAQFMNNQAVTDTRVQVQGGPSYSEAQLVAAKAPVSILPATPQTVPVAAVVNSIPAVPPTLPATPGSPGSGFTLPTVDGFDLSSIPWWGWAAGAGVALMAFGGGRR
jgi:hypothetical protein